VRLHGSTPVTRWLMSWYYQRLVITVAVTGVHRRPGVSTASLTAESEKRRRPGKDAFGMAARQLAGYSSAVLETLDETGAPWLIRARPEVDAKSCVFLLDVPRGEPLRAGPASLLYHGHDVKLWTLRSFVAVGEMEERGGRWALSCTRYVPGIEPQPAASRANGATLRERVTELSPAAAGVEPCVMWSEYNAFN
jgi:hypothetical protein